MNDATDASDEQYLRDLHSKVEGRSPDHFAIIVEEPMRLLRLAHFELIKPELLGLTDHVSALPVRTVSSLVQRAVRRLGIELGPPRTLVELWDAPDLGLYVLGLIVERKSGVLWTNQTGGTYCAHPTLEGVYLPLAELHPKHGVYKDPVQNYWHVPNPSIDDTDFLSRVHTAMNDLICHFELHWWLELRDKSNEPHGEAWIPVRIRRAEEIHADAPETPLALRPFLGGQGVLTYPNSD